MFYYFAYNLMTFFICFKFIIIIYYIFQQGKEQYKDFRDIFYKIYVSLCKNWW